MSFLTAGICYVNNHVVDCSNVLPLAGSIFMFFILLWMMFIGICIAAFIFWLLMLVHAATRPIENKALWVIVIALTHLIGAAIYYFAVKRSFDKKHKTYKQEGK